MAKTIFEQMGGTYTIQGDYCLPDLALLPEIRYNKLRKLKEAKK